LQSDKHTSGLHHCAWAVLFILQSHTPSLCVSVWVDKKKADKATVAIKLSCVGQYSVCSTSSRVVSHSIQKMRSTIIEPRHRQLTHHTCLLSQAYFVGASCCHGLHETIVAMRANFFAPLSTRTSCRSLEPCISNLLCVECFYHEQNAAYAGESQNRDQSLRIACCLQRHAATNEVERERE
jgi:hypothetical protein